jgi:hypothetical protein
VLAATFAFGFFRLGWVVGAVLLLWALWRKPRPALAAAGVIGLHLAAWAAYTWPLQRLYALGYPDRSFNVGIAAVAAAGASPVEHTQVGHRNLEPFWSAAVAALSLHRPENVVHVYGWLTPLCLIAVGAALAFGLRARTGPEPADEDDAWECVAMAWAALGLSSITMSFASPLLPFWVGSFLHKPNHAFGFAVLALALGGLLRGWGAVRLSIVLAALGWVFILLWGYALPALVIAAVVLPARRRAILTALGVSMLAILPYVALLARDHGPRPGASADQVWRDVLGRLLAQPNWLTFDLGPLLMLAVAGVLAARRRGGTRNTVLLALGLGTVAGYAGYLVGAFVGLSPEPDEFHYFARLVAALFAGVALHAGGRWIALRRRWSVGRGTVLAMAASVPLAFPAWWDPPSQDRYYDLSTKPVPAAVVAYGRWISQNTPRDAIFVAGDASSLWIPALTGRQVLLTSDLRPPHDFAERKAAQDVMLFSDDLELVQRTAARWRIRYVAVDLADTRFPVRQRARKRLTKKHPAYETVFRNGHLVLLQVRPMAAS